jgi:tRNA U34 5-carboxymethylaminomethyl modifying enzyme MnmG/GidA
MSATIQAPLDMMESVAGFRLPERADRQLQRLMDRNTNGELSDEEREELAALVELSERISLLCARLEFVGAKAPMSRKADRPIVLSCAPQAAVNIVKCIRAFKGRPFTWNTLFPSHAAVLRA